MTTWNHRVLLTEHDLFGPTYDIIEVFYNHDGSVRGYTAADVQSYESPEELRGTIEAMLTRPRSTPRASGCWTARASRPASSTAPA